MRIEHHGLQAAVRSDLLRAFSQAPAAAHLAEVAWRDQGVDHSWGEICLLLSGLLCLGFVAVLTDFLDAPLARFGPTFEFESGRPLGGSRLCSRKASITHMMV